MVTYLGLICTYVVFGGIGYLVSRQFTQRVTVWAWVILAVLTIFSQWVMVSALVVDIFEFRMFMNYSLQAFFAGILAGLSIRTIRAH